MPLTKEQLSDMAKQLKEAQKYLDEAKADLAQAKRAGIDVTEQEKQIQELDISIRKMRAVYGTA